MSDYDMIRREAEELIAFLRGAAPLHGCWFGERHHDRPAFWWRNELGRLERAIPAADARAEALKEAADAWAAYKAANTTVAHWEAVARLDAALIPETKP